MKTEDYAAFIAIDWADSEHKLSLKKTESEKVERSALKQKSEAIEDWAVSLRKRFQGQKIAVILEQSRGALIYALMKYEFFVLYPVNPATAAKYRAAFAPSGKKDDPTDADMMLDLLLRHPEKVSAWKPETEQTRKLQYLVEARRKLVNDRKRLGNRLTALLKGYYPLILELFPKMGRKVLSDFVLKYPTLSDAQKASDRELLQFFTSHNSSRAATNQSRIKLIHEAQPLVTDSAIIDSSALMAISLSRQINLLVDSIMSFDKEIEALFAQHPDSDIFNSLPACGEQMAPRLLAALGTQRDRFSSAKEIQNFTGISPVIERSGNHCWIRWRYNCSKFIRQSFVEWTGITIKHSLWARAFYAMQRKKGKSHSIAVRALAFKWIRIIYVLWKNRTTYSEAEYIKALQKSGSPIMAFLANTPELENLRFSKQKG